MAMNASTLASAIVSQLQSQGFATTNPHAWLEDFAQAVATAVVNHLTANAKANVTAGSSAGQWPLL